MAPTPTMCSATVQYLTSIIYPFPYCADYRPFYTIHDSDFKDITASNTSALPNILLGVNRDEGNYFNIYYLSDILKRQVRGNTL